MFPHFLSVWCIGPFVPALSLVAFWINLLFCWTTLFRITLCFYLDFPDTFDYLCYPVFFCYHLQLVYYFFFLIIICSVVFCVCSWVLNFNYFTWLWHSVWRWKKDMVFTFSNSLTHRALTSQKPIFPSVSKWNENIKINLKTFHRGSKSPKQYCKKSGPVPMLSPLREN